MKNPERLFSGSGYRLTGGQEKILSPGIKNFIDYPIKRFF